MIIDTGSKNFFLLFQFLQKVIVFTTQIFHQLLMTVLIAVPMRFDRTAQISHISFYIFSYFFCNYQLRTKPLICCYFFPLSLDNLCLQAVSIFGQPQIDTAAYKHRLGSRSPLLSIILVNILQSKITHNIKSNYQNQILPADRLFVFHCSSLYQSTILL